MEKKLLLPMTESKLQAINYPSKWLWELEPYLELVSQLLTEQAQISFSE